MGRGKAEKFRKKHPGFGLLDDKKKTNRKKGFGQFFPLSWKNTFFPSKTRTLASTSQTFYKIMSLEILSPPFDRGALQTCPPQSPCTEILFPPLDTQSQSQGRALLRCCHMFKPSLIKDIFLCMGSSFLYVAHVCGPYLILFTGWI